MLDKIDLEKIKEIIIQAANSVVKIYQKDFYVEYKDDKSPLTEADRVANEIICSGLKHLYPDIPILSEENKAVPYGIRKKWKYYWCIDPIDGTKEFIKKNDEFTINIALIHETTPVLGIVYAPIIDKMYSAKKDEGAYLNNQKLPLFTENKYLKIVASKSHLTPETEDFIEDIRIQYENIELVSKGSSLKLCMVAEGNADIYPRIAPTMEWDTAAAHAIVMESGKNVYIYDNTIRAIDYIDKKSSLVSVVYNKANLLNPFFVVA